MSRIRCLGMLLLLTLFQAGAFSQEDPASSGTVPESLRRPQKGEAPRYPRDAVIGELGRGAAPEDAWRLAQGILTALVRGNKEASVLAQSGDALIDGLLTGLETVAPEKYRLGGGRVEADGAVSFLVRFLGKEQSMSGELYLRREEVVAVSEKAATAGEKSAAAGEEAAAAGEKTEKGEKSAVVSPGRWLLEDLVLEEARDLADLRDAYHYDFTPYERFF